MLHLVARVSIKCGFGVPKCIPGNKPIYANRTQSSDCLDGEGLREK